MSLAESIQSLDPGAIVILLEVDATDIGGSIYRFHSGVNELGDPVVLAGNTYQPLPFLVNGVESTVKGTLPRPKLSVSNIGWVVSSMAATLDDLVGAWVSVKKILAKNLDAVNFTGGVNSSADPSAAWDDEVYVIEQKVTEDNTVVEWQLSTPMDNPGLKLPRRKIQATVCTWAYLGVECGWIPAVSQYYDSNDVPCASNLDSCGHRLSSCKIRFGEYGDLPFGAFEACGRVK